MQRPVLALALTLTVCALWLAGCGDVGQRGATLAEPRTALADPALCAPDASAAVGTRVQRLDRGQCLNATTLLDPPARAVGVRWRPLAAAPTREATPDELFNWAEVAYAELFPSRRQNLRLGPYTYRYYPESGNHVAVAEGRIYVQGPLSGGELLFVGSVADYSCLAVPSLCPGGSADCAPITQWTAGASSCQADAGQTARIAHGASYTFTDHSGPLFGAAPMVCTNGTLSAAAPATCSATPLAACNTAAVSWTVNGQTCSPNPTEPTQVASGSTTRLLDGLQTFGEATFRCANGTFSAPEGATCQARPASGNCNPNEVRWNVGSLSCTGANLPLEVANGGSYTFVAGGGVTSGRATHACSNGTLLQSGTASCALAGILDSFGGPGGDADGGASGDGTAADGAPIVGGTVRVVDTTGKVATATTDTRGYWRVRLTGMVPPLLVRVTRPDGKVRHSVSLQPLRTNGYIFIAVTGLTDKIVSDLAAQADLVGAAALTPQRMAQLSGSALPNTITALRNHPVVRPALQLVGLNPDTFDPLTTPFRADHTGYDAVLDNIVVATDSNGQTVVRTRTCIVNQVSWTVGGNTCTGGSPSTVIILNPGSTLNLSDSVGQTQGSATFGCEEGLVVEKSASCRLVP